MKRAPSLVMALSNVAAIAVAMAVVGIALARMDPYRLVTTGPTTINLVMIGLVLAGLTLCADLPLLTIVLALVDWTRGAGGQAVTALAIAWATLASPVAILMVANWRASDAERAASLAWRETLEPIEGFTARFPENPDSESLIRMEEAAARIGLPMNDPGEKGAQPYEAERRAYGSVQKALSKHVRDQVARPEESIEAPPEAVAAWLRAHDDGIAALATQLRNGGPILMATDWAAPSPPWPRPGPLLDVSNVLCLRALEHARSGDVAGAFGSMEALWVLTGALRGRGELISQLYAVVLDGATLRVLRKLPVTRPEWEDRLERHDARSALLRGVEGDAWQMSRLIQGIAALPEQGHPINRWLWRPIQRPWIRLMASNYSMVQAEAVRELQRTVPCSADVNALDDRTEESVAWWNIMGRMSVPMPAGAWVSAARVDLDAELTQKVLAARARSVDGEWPRTMPALESRVCPDRSWIYRRSDEGGVAFTLATSPGMRGPPLAFRAGPHRQAASAGGR